MQYSGPATLSKERILAQMRTTVGQPYSEQVVDQDIQNLYKSGSILNVRIFAQPEGDGVKVMVALQTRSVVRELEIDGAEKIKAKRIRKAIPIKINVSPCLRTQQKMTPLLAPSATRIPISRVLWLTE